MGVVGLVLFLQICNRRYSSSNRPDIKLIPWSVRISSEIPTRANSWGNSLGTQETILQPVEKTHGMTRHYTSFLLKSYPMGLLIDLMHTFARWLLSPRNLQTHHWTNWCMLLLVNKGLHKLLLSPLLLQHHALLFLLLFHHRMLLPLQQLDNCQ